jgi:CRP-like cAMP-binding protein
MNKLDITKYYYISKPIFEFLTNDEMNFLKGSLQSRHYRKGKDIFFENTYPKGIFMLNRGKVKIYQNTYEGNEQIISILVEGEIFGYRPLLCNEKYPVSAKAIEECRIDFIPKKDFFLLLSRSVRLSNVLLKNLSYEFTVWANTITSLGQRTVKERLLVNILILIEKYRGKKKWPVEITLSRTDLASLTGTSNESVARLIKNLTEFRLISLKGRTILINSSSQADRILKYLM